ncbi:MAG: hypothetical protein V4538_15490 [Bacteroidota bacterium]
MKSQLLNQPIEDVINERNLYQWIMMASMSIVFILCICLFVVIEQRKELQNKVDHLNTANQSLIDNMNLKQ